MTLWAHIFLFIISVHLKVGKTYFRSVKATDSTSYIEWGNDTLSRRSVATYPNWPTIERLSIKAQNDRYIVLHSWTGSDSYLDIVLPLNKVDKEMLFWNVMALDLADNIVVYEWGDADNVLFAQNIKTGDKQAIGVSWPKCSSAFPHYCISDIEIVDRVLQLTWSVPNRLEKNAVKKKYQMKLTI